MKQVTDSPDFSPPCDRAMRDDSDFFDRPSIATRKARDGRTEPPDGMSVILHGRQRTSSSSWLLGTAGRVSSKATVVSASPASSGVSAGAAGFSSSSSAAATPTHLPRGRSMSVSGSLAIAAQLTSDAPYRPSRVRALAARSPPTLQQVRMLTAPTETRRRSWPPSPSPSAHERKVAGLLWSSGPCTLVVARCLASLARWGCLAKTPLTCMAAPIRSSNCSKSTAVPGYMQRTMLKMFSNASPESRKMKYSATFSTLAVATLQ